VDRAATTEPRAQKEGFSVKSNAKMALGAVLATFGGASVVLFPLLGWSSIGRPWSFLLGFVVGIASGAGAALALFGLFERRGEQ
jgi:hypothetical protein